MKNLTISLIALTLFLGSCTVLKVSERKSNGLFKASKSAKIIKGEKLDMNEYKDLLIVMNSDFLLGMSQNLNFFDNVLTLEQFEKQIILAGKADEIGSLSGPIGLNKAYKNHRKFLYLTMVPATDRLKKVQLKLTHPGTLEDIFLAETAFDVVWAGVYDANTFNPLFNSLITFLQINSDYNPRTTPKK